MQAYNTCAKLKAFAGVDWILPEYLTEKA